MAKQCIKGDGSWQMRLDAGLCPKCHNNLSLNKKDGTIFCVVCGLEILDSEIWFDKMNKDSEQSQETDMHETHLLPSEEDFAATPEKMSWSEAVSLLEGILMDKAEDIEKQDGNPELAQEVREAWKRILAG